MRLRNIFKFKGARQERLERFMEFATKSDTVAVNLDEKLEIEKIPIEVEELILYNQQMIGKLLDYKLAVLTKPKGRIIIK